jgi:cephalosporin-C deacetylase
MFRFLLACLAIAVVARGEIKVTADHPDWLYAPGEPVKFTITAKPGTAITYTVGPEMMRPPQQKTTMPESGTLVVDGGTLQAPGFLRCTATGGGERGLATAGFAPEKLKHTQVEPADFDAFWAKHKEALAKLPIDAKLTPMPERSNDKVEVFAISLQNVGTFPTPTSRFYGVLCVPRGAGPFPAMTIPPGAGIRRYQGQVTWAERGFITLEVGIHGVPVTLDPELYTALSGALGSYQTLNLDNKDRYYYRRVYLGCLRANDYLVAHPKWDQKNLIMHGGSQGGMLSIVTSALDPRVTALVASYPAYCDVTGYLHGRAGGWPGLRFEDKAEPGLEAKIATTSYYDTVNFAKRLKVPGHYGWGFNDETCPPTSMFSAYNVITAPKTLAIIKEMGHPRVPELTNRERDWVMNVGLKK